MLTVSIIGVTIGIFSAYAGRDFSNIFDQIMYVLGVALFSVGFLATIAFVTNLLI